MLAGCGAPSPGGPAPPLVASAAAGTHERPAYAVLYSFDGLTDGAQPFAHVVNVDGTLYGTTWKGGARCGPSRCGTVFSLTPSGSERVLHRFRNDAKDGLEPQSGLLNVDGTLYGTTPDGGAKGAGTVFTITPGGKEAILYSFKGGAADGAHPVAGLTDVDGTLYGTTASGGPADDGTVFTITTSGRERVLYSFGGSGDASEPLSRLTNLDGTLYGTTLIGGTNGDGTVYSITPSGAERVLYSFDVTDGWYPTAGLINVNGTLYGTTNEGGANIGDGTVFSITTSGVETVLHSFAGGRRDGDVPIGGLLNVNGTLYGTTFRGGAHCEGRYEHGCGTIFSITTSGEERVVHNFDGVHGALPRAALTNVGGTLYGTTETGGASARGTVFKFSP